VRIIFSNDWCHKNNYLRNKKKPNQKEHLMGIIKKSMPEAVLFAIARSSFLSLAPRTRKIEIGKISALYTCVILRKSFSCRYTTCFPWFGLCPCSAFPSMSFSFLALS